MVKMVVIIDENGIKIGRNFGARPKQGMYGNFFFIVFFINYILIFVLND